MDKLIFTLEEPHGPGDVYVCWQRRTGELLATTGRDSSVSIYNKHGKLIDKITLPGLCIVMDWDSEGDLLGIISSNSSAVNVWNTYTKKRTIVDSGLRDPLTCLVWCKVGQVLAIGTARGNLTVYNHMTSKRVPVLGKHTRKITTCAWSQNNMLAVGSEDKTMSISNALGDTIRVTALRAEPSDIQFSDMKLDERSGKDNTVSVVVGQKTLFLYNLQDPNNPIELAFQARYGSILAYKWFGDGYILLGFSEGYFVQISTHIKEVGQELFQCKNHKDFLSDIAYSTVLGKVASCGDNKVKIHDVANLTEVETVITIEDDPRVERISWSDDGQLLAVTTSGGSIKIYLSKLPKLVVANNGKIAILSSLNQVSVYLRSIERKGTPWTNFIIETEIEPSFLNMGPYHVAVGMNNRVWVYGLNPSVNNKAHTLVYKPQLLGDKEYLGTITSLLLNANYSSALVNSRIQLHYLGDNQKTIPDAFVDKESKLFPESGEKYTIMTQAMSEEFLFFATSEYELKIFSLSEWKFVSGYKHSDKIKSIYPDIYGICLVLIEMNNTGFLYHTAMDYLLPIPEFPPATEEVLWDTVPVDRNVFVCCSKTSVVTYLFMPNYYEGPKITLVGATTIQSGQSPVLLTKGLLTLVTSSNKPLDLTLETHKTTMHNPKQTLDISLHKVLKLLNWKEAWNICAVLNQSETWRSFAEACLQNLEFSWAIRAYQSLDEAGMVWCLESLVEEEEDTSILCGHVAALLGNHDTAQQRYLTSDIPTMALILRRDLRQWREALALATSLGSNQTPIISCDYAQQLEMTGQHAQALSFYQKSMELATPDIQDPECQRKCKEGIARTSIRVGDFRLGIRLAAESNSSVLKNECADILQQFNKLNDAVTLYESAGNYEKAATCYIQLKNWTKIGQLLPHIKSATTFIQYAKAKEAMGSYRESVGAYERAEDYDNVVRVDLDHLNDIRHAVDIVKAKKCTEGAKRIADYCNKHGDFGAAIHFLILSKCYQDAFNLSQQHKKLHEFGKFLLEEDEPNPVELKRLAIHFEEDKDMFRAAQYYYHAKEYGRAMKLLLVTARQDKDSDENLWLGVSIVSDSHDEKLVETFKTLLEGKLDGVKRNSKFLYRVLMNTGDYVAASSCALDVARDEAARGSYRNCHETLYSTIQELKKHKLQVGNDLMAGLMIIHSYLLARYHVRNANHSLAAPLLIRVAENISFFPLHATSILTSTVIECKKANLQESALKFATLLLRPEYRSNLEDKYRKQIELIVRKAPRKDIASPEEAHVLPCPYCDTMVPDMMLHCASCARIIPFCIASGKHITRNELTKCLECNFPAIHRHLVLIVDQEGFCPLCRTDLRGRPLPTDIHINEL
ncbi:hypothetical protein M8J76_013327 [Diaphorina citri]|nr:hypothetical protein M8J75_008400 [Diaphorina citri]KAI5750166.1 hypothetical protein M8J76_013327 [Diaphorina citri]